MPDEKRKCCACGSTTRTHICCADCITHLRVRVEKLEEQQRSGISREQATHRNFHLPPYGEASENKQTGGDSELRTAAARAVAVMWRVWCSPSVGGKEYNKARVALQAALKEDKQ